MVGRFQLPHHLTNTSKKPVVSSSSPNIVVMEERESEDGTSSGLSKKPPCLHFPVIPFGKRRSRGSRAGTSQSSAASSVGMLGQFQQQQQQQRQRQQQQEDSEEEEYGQLWDVDSNEEPPVLSAPWRGGVKSSIYTSSPPPQRQPQKLGPTTAVVTPPSRQPPSTADGNSSCRGIAHLLTPPTAEDRSERRRQQYEDSLRNSSRPQRGLYEGELEPAGLRGQEASLALASAVAATKSSPLGAGSVRMHPQQQSLQIVKPASSSSLHSHHHNRLLVVREVSQESSSASASFTTDMTDEHSKESGGVMYHAPRRIPPPTNTTTTTKTSTAYSVTRAKTLPPQHQQRVNNTIVSPKIHPTQPPPHQQRVALTTQPQPSRINHVRTRPSGIQRPSPSRVPQHEQHQPRQRAAAPMSTSTNRMHSDAESTCSDEDIQHMVSDFLEPSGGTPPNILFSPSAVENDIPTIFSPTNANKQEQSHVQRSTAPTTGVTGDGGDGTRTKTMSSNSGGSSLMFISPSSSSDQKILSKEQMQLKFNSSVDTTDMERLQSTAADYVRAGNYEAALEAFTTVLQYQLERHGRKHAATAAAHHNLGTVQAKRAAACLPDSFQQRQFRAKALESFQAAARSARDASPDSQHPHPNVAVSLVRVGFLLLQSKQYQNAVVTFNEALRIRLAHYGKHHGLSANLYNNLGVCCLHMGEFERGLYHLEQALQIQRHLVQKTQGSGAEQHDPSGAVEAHQLELADTLFNIGGLCLEWMRLQGPDARHAEDAESAFRECVSIRSDVLGPDDPHTRQALSLLEVAQSTPRPRRIKTTVTPAKAGTSKHSSNRYVTNPSAPNKNAGATKRARGISTPSGQQPMSARKIGGDGLELPSVRRSVEKTNTAHNLSPSLSPIRSVPDSPPDASTPEPSIFRVSKNNNQSPVARHVTPESDHTRDSKVPLLQITVSKEGGTDEERQSPGTRIFMAPHLIAESSSLHRDKQQDMSIDAVVGSSYDKDGLTVDTSNEGRNTNNTSLRLPQLSHLSYDAEENCIISDSGVDSDIGRIHYPLAWSRAGIQTSTDQVSSQRDIMVARLVHSRAGEGGATSTNNNNNRNTGQADSDLSDKWGSETVNVSTGNTERDEILARTRALLEVHAPESPRRPDDRDSNNDKEKTRAEKKSSVMEQDLMEDGIASLGGDWGLKDKRGEAPKTVQEMLQDPLNYMKEIHEEASKQLKKNNAVDAFRLFEVVLQCQRHRHGPLHPTVAAALHNIGITQLRSQNHAEALKAFEEAARVRKGSLGKDHPLVAVSLVKVGITLLLLHRFEEALWSFREALSVRKHSLGALHPTTARIYNNIGCVYVEFNEFKEARRAFEAALDIQRSALCNEPSNGPLMFGTATTLCNLGYLYRYRDMHAKAASVLKEAVDLQETVLGRSHATVLSTLDNLADSCANSGNAADALNYYNMVLGRFREGGVADNSNKQHRAEAVLLYKVSRVHRQQNDREAQLVSLKHALDAIRHYSQNQNGRTDTLERRIYYDIRACREQLEKEGLKWI